MAFYTDGVVPWNSLDDNTRAPLASELENGYPCGEADQELFNWTAGWPIGQVWNLLLRSGLTPSANKLLDLTRATRSQALNYFVASGAASAIVITPNPSFLSLSELIGVPLRIKTGSSTANSTVTLNVNGLGPTPIAAGDAPITNGLPPNTVIDVVFDGVYFQILSSRRARIQLQANTTFYMSRSGDDSNSGSSSLPFKTMQGAWNYLLRNVDLNGYSVTVQMAAGTYPEPFEATGKLVGQQDFSGTYGVTFLGNIANPGSVIVNAANTNALSSVTGALFVLSGMTLASSGNLFSTLNVRNGGQIVIGSGIVIGAAGGNIQMNASYGGIITINAPYTISGGAVQHWSATQNGIINISAGLSISLTGSPAFSSAFCIAGDCGVVRIPGLTYSGSATGQRYSVVSNGVINTTGGGPNYLPGSIAGATGTGGQYI